MRKDLIRKLLVVILSVTMVISSVPTEALAEAVADARIVTDAAASAVADAASQQVENTSAPVSDKETDATTTEDPADATTTDDAADATTTDAPAAETATDDPATAAAADVPATTEATTAVAPQATIEQAVTSQDDLVVEAAGSVNVEISSNQTLTISDADEAGKLKLTGVGNDQTISGDTRIVLLSKDGGTHDSSVDVEATKATVNIILTGLHLRHDDDSPFRVQPGTTTVITLVGSNDLTCSGSGQSGLQVRGSANLTIQGTGSLYAKGDSYSAGIGTGDKEQDFAPGNLTITGGAQVTAVGGDEAAGIGCGNEAKAGGTVTISGSGTKVIAKVDGDYGAGIGGGDQSGACDNVYVKDGATVEATGGKGGAGIGSGDKDTGFSGNLTVEGDGTLVTATGGDGAAGVGSGNDAHHGGTVTVKGGRLVATGGGSGDSCGAGIGGGYNTGGNDVVVSGGTVVARAGSSDYGWGIGRGGSSTDNSATLTVTGGSVLGTYPSGDKANVQNAPSGCSRYVVSLKGVPDDTLLTGLKLSTSDNKSITYGSASVWTAGGSTHDGNGTLYLYLPTGSSLHKVTANGTTYTRVSGADTDATGTFSADAASYVVRFDANGGTGTMEDQTIEAGASANLSANTFTFGTTGVEFSGWNTKADGSGTAYAEGRVSPTLPRAASSRSMPSGSGT